MRDCPARGGQGSHRRADVRSAERRGGGIRGRRVVVAAVLGRRGPLREGRSRRQGGRRRRGRERRPAERQHPQQRRGSAQGLEALRRQPGAVGKGEAAEVRGRGREEVGAAAAASAAAEERSSRRRRQGRRQRALAASSSPPISSSPPSSSHLVQGAGISPGQRGALLGGSLVFVDCRREGRLVPGGVAASSFAFVAVAALIVVALVAAGARVIAAADAVSFLFFRRRCGPLRQVQVRQRERREPAARIRRHRRRRSRGASGRSWGGSGRRGGSEGQGQGFGREREAAVGAQEAQPRERREGSDLLSSSFSFFVVLSLLGKGRRGQLGAAVKPQLGKAREQEPASRFLSFSLLSFLFSPFLASSSSSSSSQESSPPEDQRDGSVVCRRRARPQRQSRGPGPARPQGADAAGDGEGRRSRGRGLVAPFAAAALGSSSSLPRRPPALLRRRREAHPERRSPRGLCEAPVGHRGRGNVSRVVQEGEDGLEDLREVSLVGVGW